MHMCPSCNSSYVGNSSRFDMSDFLVRLFTLKRPYRCLECWQRFYDYRSATPVPNPNEESIRRAGATLLPERNEM